MCNNNNVSIYEIEFYLWHIIVPLRWLFDLSIIQQLVEQLSSDEILLYFYIVSKIFSYIVLYMFYKVWILEVTDWTYQGMGCWCFSYKQRLKFYKTIYSFQMNKRVQISWLFLKKKKIIFKGFFCLTVELFICL